MVIFKNREKYGAREKIWENCGWKMLRVSYIPFNGGKIVCSLCFNEWERLGELKLFSKFLSHIINVIGRKNKY